MNRGKNCSIEVFISNSDVDIMNEALTLFRTALLVIEQWLLS